VHNGPVTCLLRMGEVVFSASGDSTLRVWEAAVQTFVLSLCLSVFVFIALPLAVSVYR
jgi:hypothetical protein